MSRPQAPVVTVAANQNAMPSSHRRSAKARNSHWCLICRRSGTRSDGHEARLARLAMRVMVDATSHRITTVVIRWSPPGRLLRCRRS